MNPPTRLPALVTEWRERARTLHRIGDPNCARLWTLAADELAAAIDAEAEATLTLRDAARETRYTADHLASLIKRGVIPNAGREGAPRIRRADLPPPKRTGGPGRPKRPRLGMAAEAVRRLSLSSNEEKHR